MKELLNKNKKCLYLFCMLTHTKNQCLMNCKNSNLMTQPFKPFVSMEVKITIKY